MSFTLSSQSWASLFKDGGQISVRSFHEPVRMKTAERIYCEGDSESTAPPSGTGGNRVKGSRGVQSEGGGRRRDHSFYLKSASALNYEHTSHITALQHTRVPNLTRSIIYTVCIIIFNKWVWVVCIGVCFCVCFSTYQEST